MGPDILKNIVREHDSNLDERASDNNIEINNGMLTLGNLSSMIRFGLSFAGR